ncbi:GNAT family N-acetyltransferase [Brevundimonas bacteroides]|uniref:GNAT family N-acetyltransferase n=1 Tax=Brevundimonas bacteroides TaxID=74311 RepID=UPI00049539B7|nr:N-acetyltransferase [Brevundimonas bacteroides]
MTDLDIRDAVPADILALHALIESAYRGEASRAGWTTEADLLDGQRTDPEELADIIAAEDQGLLVGWRGGAAIACVKYQRLTEGVGYFGMLSVGPALQSAGIGRRMVEAAEERLAARHGANRIRIHVFPQRDSLIAWYQRLGYALTGETAPFPYGDERFGLPRRDDLHFVILEKPLG